LLNLINSKAMNRILNPFEYLSTGKALGWGLAGTLFSICLLTAVSWPVGDDLSKIVTILSSNLLLWIPLSLLLYVLALLFSPSRIRAVDIFATNLFAMLPTIVILGVLSVPSKWLGGLVCEPRSACEVMKLAGYNLIVILLSVSMAWSMVWGCFAYLVSANMKGWRGISIFVICYVFVSVVNQLLIAYSK
jgi:membrane protein